MDAPSLKWSPKYEIGVARIDQQHEQLFLLFGEAAKAFNEGKGAQIVTQMVHDLIAYTQTHFRDEEALMVRTRYPATAIHKAEHQALLDEVHGFAAQLEQGKPDLAYDLLLFLRSWLVAHVMTEDIKLTPYMGQIHQ